MALNETIRGEFYRLYVATDSAFAEKDKSAKQAQILAVRAELVELMESLTTLRNHFDVDQFDADKSMKDFPAVTRIRQKKGTEAKKTGNPFATV